MTHARRWHLLLLLFLLCLSVSAQRSRLLRVPQSFRTIQSAVDAARTGDSVLVAHGVYYENVRIAKNIVVGSRTLVDGDLAHRTLTIIDGSRARDRQRGSTITVSGPCDTTCVILGFTVRGGTGTVIHFNEPPPFDWWVAGGGIVVRHAGARIVLNHLTQNRIVSIDSFANVTGAGLAGGDETGGQSLPPLIIVERNVVSDNSLMGGRSEAGGISISQPAIIRDNLIEGNRARAPGRAPGGGIGAFFTGPYDILIERNIIRSNVAGIAGGIVLGIPLTQRGRAIISNNIIADNIAYEVGGAVNLGEGSWGLFINNTIVGNRAGASGGAISVPTGSTATLVNNIIWANGPEPISNWSETRMMHNIIQGGYPGWMNISVDPLFIPGDSLYRLSPESPAIGLGLDTLLVAGEHYSILMSDLFNRPRPPGIRPDMGAMEHPATSSEASEEVRSSWDASSDRRLKIFISFRQITPTERSYDSMQTVQAGRMKIGLAVNDTGFIDLSNPGLIPTFTLPPGTNLLDVELRPRGLDGKRRLFSLLRLEGYEHATYSIPRGRGYGIRQYVDLAPRAYMLRFGTADEVGLIDGSNWRAIRIVVPPYWYQQWWAFALYGALVVLAATQMVRVRTRRLRLQQDLRIEHLEREKLAEVDRLKSQFFANISHELRTPLTLIQGPVDELLATANTERDRERLSLIRRNAEKLLKLIEQLLHFTRVESGNATLEVARHEVVAILRRACDAFASRAERKGIRFRFTTTTPEVHGWIDAEKLEHIIENLVSNAIKFTASAGQVNILATVDQGELTVVVEDTGSGIEAQHLPHVFERFYRADKTHKVEGTGIGLSLTKELVDLHRGRIKIDSEPGIGTTVTVTLPLEGYLKSEMVDSPAVDDHAPPQRVPDVPITRPDNGPAGDRPIILVVEDNDDARAFIGSSLNGHYDVHLASSGKEALGIAQHVVPDVVISDVMMPGMDGYELCRELKSNESTSHIPVILLTALADRTDRIAGLEHGADEYLTKPFDRQELHLRLRNLLHQRDEVQRRHRHVVSVPPSQGQRLSLEDAFLQKVNASILAHLADEQYGIEVLANDVALSRTQVYRKLKALTSLSPLEYIRRIRLLRAKELLAHHTGTISEIAFQTGFSNASWFTKCYREEFGVLPSETRGS